MASSWPLLLRIAFSLQQNFAASRGHDIHDTTPALRVEKRKNYALLELLRSYLDNRKQRVVINSIPSESVDVESGVLSGMLFSLYINDLPEVMTTCQISLYADDAKL